MINLMYLVLTALLALNVSAEILNAFKTVERSLTETNKTINNSTETIVLKGSLLADKLSFSGPCRIEFVSTDNEQDPFQGLGIIGGYGEGD